ncbi:MAG: IS66 family insertion sequence element accessory protein TnpB [Lachnospiraceae bacterium]|nr:IS66 family insertion sequence element accessory protein TnpB [Lachnospiraceae bacterium]MEE1255303.1 IS66 family insertion sequence element accessory protein TnpB [Lachnospiraceae bacterium]
MDQVTKVRRHIKREEWKSIISECRASGMTVKAWCKANGIVEQTYYRNLKMLREEMLASLPAPIVNDDCTEKPTVFKKLEVTTPVENTKAAVVIRLGGATVEVNEGTSQQTIQAVLLALQGIC